jgi:hypothetical protein
LLGITEKQLELGNVNRSATISWQRHWKKVAQDLKEHDYAYWNLFQDDRPLATGVGNDAELAQSESSEEAEVPLNCI